MIAFAATFWPLPQPQTLPISLYVANANGTNLDILVDSIHVEDFAWSPDGQSVAFTGLLNPNQAGENFQIYIVNVANSTIHQATYLDEGALTVTWAPEGNRLAFDTNLHEIF